MRLVDVLLYPFVNQLAFNSILGLATYPKELESSKKYGRCINITRIYKEFTPLIYDFPPKKQKGKGCTYGEK
jgi:hypothetical protein